MRRPTRREVFLAITVAILVAVLLLWFRGCGPTSSSATDSGLGSVSAPSSFTIGGDLRRPVSPGELEGLDLTLNNTNDVDLVIDQISVAVVEIDAPSADAEHPCTAADFEVRNLGWGVQLTLAGNSSNDLSGLGLSQDKWPAVGMINRPVNQDGCKGASLTLSYQASGMEVSR